MHYYLILFCLLFVLPLNGLNVTVINSSAREVFVKFTGNNLVVDQPNSSIAAGQSHSYSLTNVSAGRMYLSFDEALSSNNPDGANPSDPDYLKRFDKVEITYNSGGKANLTAVDFYAIPLLLQTSIASLYISQYTLDPNTTGNELEQALINVATDSTKTKIWNGTETVRVLSPVKAPTGYPNMNTYVSSTINDIININGHYFSGGGVQSYAYTGTIGTNTIALTMPNKKSISIPVPGLSYSPGDPYGNAIYTCNGVYYLDGNTNNPHFVSDNDFYSAVYRCHQRIQFWLYRRKVGQ